jgi:hypothetical protein
MNLKDIYLREIYLKKFCDDLEDSLQLTEEINNSALTDLLKQAEQTIFPRFGIKSNEPNKYFIAGSARLHLYPQLATILNDTIGDLDIVIPGQKEWDYLNNYLESKKLPSNPDELSRYIYRPKDAPKLEAFDVWDPSKVDPEKFKDTQFTSTSTLLKTSGRKPVGGYYFMPLSDIVDYKMKLDRTKEEGITSLLSKYINAKSEDEKQDIRTQIIRIFAGDETAAKSFLSPVLSNQVKRK